MLRISISIFFAFLVIHCQNPAKKQPNYFSSNEDTLLIKTEVVKGTEPFSFGAITIQFKDTIDLFEYPIIYPNNLSNIRGTRMWVDFKTQFDFIDIIKGSIGNEDVIIIDQNNNKDFTDDENIKILPIDWYSSENSIPVDFIISNGLDTIRSSSWIRLGTQNGNIFYAVDEHRIAEFTIDQEIFKIGVFDQPSASTFTYGVNPEITLFTYEDSIKLSELLRIGEFISLNGIYYKFDSINNNGEYLSLVKERNFEKKIGTQVGMIAPDFIYKSVKGDTMGTKRLHDKPLIIANSCGCGGDVKSTQTFYDIKERYKDIVYALRLDSGIDEIDVWSIDMNDDFNKDAYNKFRQTYCSRVCYIIGKNGRVLDKFVITDWELFLPKYLSL